MSAVPAHITVASRLGLGVYTPADRYVHDTRLPFRRVVGGPVVDPGFSVAYGTHRGHEVILGFTRERPSASIANQFPVWTLFDAIVQGDTVGHYALIRVAPSLLLGLRAGKHPEGLRLSSTDYGLQSVVATGQPAFDERFSVRALAPMCVPGIFARKGDGGDIVDVAVAAHDAKVGVNIEDACVSIGLARSLEDAESFAWALDAGIRIAERLASARAALPPPPWEAAIAAALEALAKARSLTFERARLAASGSTAQISTSVALTTTLPSSRLPSYAIEIAAYYPALGVRLSVYPQHVVPGLVKFFLRDVEVGDAPFDKAFIVNAEKSAPVGAWLGPVVRARMLSMVSQAAWVNLDHERVALYLHASVQDPAMLAYAYDDVVAVATNLSRAVHGATEEAPRPYR